MLDPRFRVEVLSATHNPQTCIYKAMHQDYSEEFVFDEPTPSEKACGEIAVKRLLANKRGHYGPLEHQQIVYNVGWFPHDVMQQARTHRIGCSFDVQSGRYTGQRIIDVANGLRDLEDVFYLRPVGNYTNREGKKYNYSNSEAADDWSDCMNAAHRYAVKVNGGMAEEHARGRIGYDIRQHFVVSFTMRALMHFLCVRSKLDAQLEIQELCNLMLPGFAAWAPEIHGWYMENLHQKSILAP